MVDKLYKRSLFEEIKFPIGRIYEDLAISYQVFYNASKIVIKDVPQYHYVIRRGSSLQSKYNPQREYQLVQAVNEQVDFVIKHAIMPVDIASYYIVRRCIRFIDHLSLVPMTPQVQYFVDDALTKIRCYANVDKVLLGHSLAIKRRFITRHLPAYQKCYRFVVKLLKFKRK